MDLRSGLHVALAEARRAKARAGGDAAAQAAQFDYLTAKLETALRDLDRGTLPSIALLTKWVIDWIPDIDDPIVAALHQVESAAST